MNKISKYLDFISEATLGKDKISVNYQLSRPGREKAINFSNNGDLESLDIKFVNTEELPNDIDNILIIKSTTFSKINYLDYKELNHLTDDDIKDNFMIYKVISDDIDIKWAITKVDQKTSVIRQSNRTGASKRGDYFRETAFIIMLAKIAWEKEGVKLTIHSNRGEIEMDYNIDAKSKKRVAEMSNLNSIEFRDAFYDFENKSSKSIIKSMEKHCEKLINYLGDRIDKVKYITKNNSKWLINSMAINFMREESQIKKQMSIDTQIDFDIPDNANVSKWNPSDIWIVFDDNFFSNESAYTKRGIDDIDSLNKFLYKSLMNKTGIVGVSLKMSRGKSELYKITGDIRYINRYKDFDVSNSKKTAKIDFQYRKDDSESRWYNGAGIDCRTFDSSNTSSISLELRGKKGAGYVSGKAGSIITHLMPDEYYRIKDMVRREPTKDTLRTALNIDFDRMDKDKTYKPAYLPKDERLKKVFLKDLEGDGPKNSAENSRLQTVVFLDWILNLSEEERNSVITTIVRYAKSESLWSAPHIVLK